MSTEKARDTEKNILWIHAHEAPGTSAYLCVRNRLGPPGWGAGVFQAAAPLLLLHLGVSCTGVFTVKIHSSGQVGCVHFAVCILCCAVLGHFSGV